MAKAPKSTGIDNASRAKSIRGPRNNPQKGGGQRPAGIDNKGRPDHIDGAGDAREPGTHAQPNSTRNHPMPQITIQGHAFEVPTKYAEGHALTANEASALDQVRRENLRNNFAAKIQAQVDALNKDLPEGQEKVTITDWAPLEAEFAKFTEAYEFGARTGGGGRVTDPVQKEAKRLATELVENAIKAKHGKLDAVSKESKDAAVTTLMAREDIQAQAKATVEAAKGLAADLGIEI